MIGFKRSQPFNIGCQVGRVERFTRQIMSRQPRCMNTRQATQRIRDVPAYFMWQCVDKKKLHARLAIEAAFQGVAAVFHIER
jgi:hypothetical protein